MKAYYNEFDQDKCAWLQKLMDLGAITPGKIDDRSIADVSAEDVRGYERVHWFAGIGVWDYALNLAGWRGPVYSGSCPCPPFSSAGKKKACPSCGGTNPVPHVGRTGFFVCCLCGHEWLADERHLWPELWRLIRDGRPERFVGEQVAGADGAVWFTLVRASLEILGYAVGGANLAAAGVGAPHIRQRLFFVADAKGCGSRTGLCDQRTGAFGGYLPPDCGGAGGMAESREGGRRARFANDDARQFHPGRRGEVRSMVYPVQPGLGGHDGHGRDGDESGRNGAQSAGSVAEAGEPGWMADRSRDGRREECADGRRGDSGDGAQGSAAGLESGGNAHRMGDSSRDDERRTSESAMHRERFAHRGSGGDDGSGWLADADGRIAGNGRVQSSGEHGQQPEDSGADIWSNPVWVHCRPEPNYPDGRWRPLQRATESLLESLAPGTARDLGLSQLPGGETVFAPLIEKGRNRVMRLKGYGDAICAPLAVELLRAYLETERTTP